eukprot:TRINITY_DN2965_c0_g1_i1.p1 TRINITY_DN2965_c0_g1~~TRINITY_DN2965_c0_g1_i1.p1  ORF type:complete len:384 (-),score=45.27 TRINITY_DN2965_c0_g1_i1:7-1158(-)
MRIVAFVLGLLIISCAAIKVQFKDQSSKDSLWKQIRAGKTLEDLVKTIPSKYLIDVPYHMQITDYGCGDASMQMVLNYWEPEIDQLSIADVMRTSTAEGTLSVDMVRGAHFSSMSSSVGIDFPNVSLSAGYPSLPLGLAAFWRDSDEFWLDDLKFLIANDYPIAVLMHFLPNGTHDGHFRVVTGYDDTTEQITMNDPWNRDGYPPVAVWSYADFKDAWYYFEPAQNARNKPYFGAFIAPLHIEADIHYEPGQNKVAYLSAYTVYPCFSPWFECKTNIPLQNLIVSLEYDVTQISINATSWFSGNASTSSYNLGTLLPGDFAYATWTLVCQGSCVGQQVKIKAAGVVASTTPETYCCNSTDNVPMNYPAYTYTDMIGGDRLFTL